MACKGNLEFKKCSKILDKNADYLLAVKGNQGSLEQAIGDFYKPSMLQNFDEGDSYSTQEKGQGKFMMGIDL